MKKLFSKSSMALAIVIVVWTNSLLAANLANYFRVWQGFKRPDLSSEEFLTSFPTFMKETVDLYQDQALVNYIVVIPPESKPEYIPDELALVSLTSKEDYDRIRATPEGRKYSARHWDFFDRANSKSADPLVNYDLDHPVNLIHNRSYDMIGTSIDWATGYNAVFIGIRKDGLDSTQFLSRLKQHVELAKAVMVPKGLRGYIIIANELYEIAYLNWDSKESHDRAVQTQEGQDVFADAADFMDVLMYTEAVPFAAGSPIRPGQAYSTLQ